MRVESETLTFDLTPGLDAARVQATYRLISTAAAAATVEMAFVFAGGGPAGAPDPGIAVDGRPVPFVQLSEDEAAGLERLVAAAGAQPWLDPVSGVPTAEAVGDGAGLTWLTFSVPFDPGAGRTVTVAYTHTPAWHRSMRANQVYQYQYLLSPARAWAGFGPLTIAVRLPDPAYFTANLPFQPDGGGYRIELSGLPEQDLSFAVMSRRGIRFGLTRAGPYWLMLLCGMALAGMLPGWLCGRWWRKAGSAAARVLLCIFGTGSLGLIANSLLLIPLLTARRKTVPRAPVSQDP